MNSLRVALSKRVVIADGAMGTMLQARNPSLEDFQNHEGCNEILNVTRADIVKAVHAVIKRKCMPQIDPQGFKDFN